LLIGSNCRVLAYAEPMCRAESNVGAKSSSRFLTARPRIA
jgi:hypothetical protein